MEILKIPEDVSKKFSLVFNIINPIIASLITYFFVFLLKDLLLLDFIFNDQVTTIIGFLCLSFAMIVTSMSIPRTRTIQD